MKSVTLPPRWRPEARAQQTCAVVKDANRGPSEEDPDEDWDACEVDPTSDGFWESDAFDDGEEPDPEHGDFWQDPDDLENLAGT